MWFKSFGLLVLSAAAARSAAIGGTLDKRAPQRIGRPSDPLPPTPGDPADGGRVIIFPDPVPGAGDVNNRCTRRYVVKSGDSCWAISQTYGTTIEAIMFYNDITDPTCPIFPGQILCV